MSADLNEPCFVDTCILFSVYAKEDKYHKKAVEIMQYITAKHKKIFYSDYVLDETATRIKSREGKNKANEALEILLNSELQMMKIELRHITVAIELFRKYDCLSFTDCTSIALMLDYSIKTIYSFDKEFDSVPKIIRKEEP